MNVPHAFFFVIAKKLETVQLGNIARTEYEILKDVYSGLNSVPPKFMSFWNLRMWPHLERGSLQV